MIESVTVGNVVVPGAVAALVVAAWELLSQRALKALEARLARQGEAFRLAQSPRVEAAVELWGAVCEYERAVRDLVARYDPLDPEADSEERRFERQLHSARATEVLRAAHPRVVAARARSECLLPPEVHEAVERYYRRVADADNEHAVAAESRGDADDWAEAMQAAHAALEEAKALRDPAVAALRATIEARG